MVLMMLAPLWLPKYVAVATGLLFVFATEARGGTKLMVAGAVSLSLILQYGFPGRWTSTVALVLQVIVSIGVLIYFKQERR